MIVSLWNLTGISAALLLRSLSNFRAIGKVWTRISRLWDFTRSCCKTPVRLVNRSLGFSYSLSNLLYVLVASDCSTAFQVITNRMQRCLNVPVRTDVYVNYVCSCFTVVFIVGDKQGKSEGFESCDRPIVRKCPIWLKISDVLSRVTLKFDGWPWKTIWHLSFVVSSSVQHFIAIGEFKLKLQSGNAQFGSNWTIFRAVWPWNLMDDLGKQ